MKNIKKIILNPWLIAIIAPIITTGIVAVIKEVNFGQATKYIFNIIINILNYKVSIKIILIVVAILILVFLMYIKLINFKEEQKPAWINYTKDRYKEWFFKWTYIKVYNKYSIEDITPICKCGCILSRKDRHNNRYYSNGVLVCPKCNSSYSNLDIDDINDFKAIIYHNIETNNYRVEE